MFSEISYVDILVYLLQKKTHWGQKTQPCAQQCNALATEAPGGITNLYVAKYLFCDVKSNVCMHHLYNAAFHVLR